MTDVVYNVRRGLMKFEKVRVCNFDNALRGMRNPMNSWAKSDSEFGIMPNDMVKDEIKVYIDDSETYCEYAAIGPNDMDLACRLIKAGTEHRKFLRQISVSVDITAPLYWWKEFDTYKVGTTANSTSTMHKIHSKQFERSDFSCDRMSEKALNVLDNMIEYLEEVRVKFVETKDKAYWHDMIQLLPSSYNQTRTVTMNYENLRSMYHQREHHKLAEWKDDFCGWVATLPYAKEFIIN